MFHLNIFLATLFYEWRKDISQQMWESRNYKITSYFVPTVIVAATLQFKRHPSSSFNSRCRVYYEVKQSSNYEFVKKPVESSLSVCSVLYRLMRRQNIVSDCRLLRSRYCRSTNDLISILGIFFNENL